MTATILPPPPFDAPMVVGGYVSRAWQPFFEKLYALLYGSGFDRVDAAMMVAAAALPQSAQVVASGGLQAGGSFAEGDVGVALYRVRCAVAQLPGSANTDGDWAYAYDGRKPGEGAGSGTGVPCFWSSGSWIAVTSGAAVTS